MADNKIRVCYLSTSDNPFNPAEEFDKWLAWDEGNGYHSCAYLARVAKVPQSASEVDALAEIERAIDEIVKVNLYGTFIKVVKEIPITEP